MKAISITVILASWVGLTALGGTPARAQSEVDPDHFESRNVEPFAKTKANRGDNAIAVHYDGKLTLPYAVQCSGKKLSAGQYTVSLQSNGKTGQATLRQKSRAMGFPGIVQKHENKNGNDALVVVELNGKIRKLSAIQVAELDLVFEPALMMDTSSDRRSRRFEKLPLTMASQRQ